MATSDIPIDSGSQSHHYAASGQHHPPRRASSTAGGASSSRTSVPPGGGGGGTPSSNASMTALPPVVGPNGKVLQGNALVNAFKGGIRIETANGERTSRACLACRKLKVRAHSLCRVTRPCSRAYAPDSLRWSYSRL